MSLCVRACTLQCLLATCYLQVLQADSENHHKLLLAKQHAASNESKLDKYRLDMQNWEQEVEYLMIRAKENLERYMGWPCK